MKNKKVMKRVLVIAIVAAIAGGSIGTGVYVQRAKMTAEVMSVADLNSGYWGDDVNSSGMIILSLWKLRIRMKSKRCM